MKVQIGNGAEKKTWQDPFEKVVDCVHCNSSAELAFVAYEGLDNKGDKQSTLCSLKDTTGTKGGLWLHDCCAVAVYFCRNCLEPTAEYNQG